MNISLKNEYQALEKKQKELMTWLQNPGSVPVDAVLDKRLELHEINARMEQIDNELSITD